MARANGYIIAKQFQKEADNFQVSMDISPDDSLLVFGYGPMIKLVNFSSSGSFWFSDKKIFPKNPIYCKDLLKKQYIPNNQRVVRDVRWNCSDLGKNFIGVVMGQSAFVYDAQDTQNSKTPQGFLKVFQADDVMRGGDYSSKFIWYPNSKDVFLCTSSKSDEIISRDLRQPGVVAKFNGFEDSKPEQKIQDLKFNPIDSNIFATISKSSTIEIFDYRKPIKSIIKSQSAVQSYKTNLLDWKKDGKKLVSAFGGLVKLWNFNGMQLKQQYSFQHKNAISDFKWLKKKYSDYLLVSQMQQNIIYGYKIEEGRHDIQILVDPRHSGLKKFITNKKQQIILGLTNFQDSKKHQHQMIAVFFDYESSKNIWQITKFKKPNHLGLDNQLLFSAPRFMRTKDRPVDSSFTLIYKQIQSSAQKIKLEVLGLKEKVSIQEKRIQLQKKQAIKQTHNKLKQQRKQLKRQIKQKSIMQNTKMVMHEQQSMKSEQKSKPTSLRRNQKVKKSSSIEQSRSQKSLTKNQRMVDKLTISKKSDYSFSESSEENDLTFIQKDRWILEYCEEVQYLDQNYKIQINDQTPDQRAQVLCKHNSKIAESIGKDRCAEFWKYIYSIAFPQNQQKYNLSGLYEDKIKLQVSFKDNKVVASCDNKGQMIKKTIKYSLEKLIQNLVDENELQTAVMACIMIRNKNQKLLSLQFIQPFLVCYKQLLKAMDLTFISANLSYIAKLNQAVPSGLFAFDIPIGCGQCYRKFNEEKCTCLQVCIICGQPLISRLVVGCKICGHMAHARQYQQLIDRGIKKCPYDKCQHDCFKKI